MRIFIASIVLLLVFSGPAFAQTYAESLEAIATLNTIQPLQNPQFETGAQILNRRVLDSANKVVGEIDSVLVDESGAVDALNVEFNRLNLATPVYLDFGKFDIGSVTNGYVLSFRDNQIAALYPDMLADIETAAGPDAPPVFSIRALQSATVKDDSGRFLGVVDNVLFNKTGRRAEALYVAMKFGTLRGKSLAVPFTLGQYINAGSKTEVTVSKATGDAMIDFTRNLKYDSRGRL